MLKGIKFGVTAIQSGQKSALVNATPQLFAKSTPGQFVITAPVSKALGIAVGENVMFGNNIANIEAALNNPSDEIVAYANENGWDLNTREGMDAFIKDQTVYFIAKGILRYKKTGEPQMAAVRISTAEKESYLENNAASIIAKMSAEDKQAFAEARELEDWDDEVLASALTIDDVDWPTVHAATGSKTATTSTATGVGVQLSFTDTAIWEALKADLADKSAVNRTFDVKLDEGVQDKIHNGYEYVDVTYYPLVFVEDTKPLTREAKSAE